MKKYISILSVALAATLLASCNKEVSDDSIAYYIDKSEITAVVPQPVMAGMSADKAVIYEDGVVKFEWIKNIDAISVNAGVDGETMLYTVKSVDEAPTHCVFKVENFLLNAVADYYAVYPMTASTTTVVPFDMAGQCQKAFDDNSHLSEYSYMTAGPVKSNRYGGLDFPFQYKVSWVVFNIMSPKTFTAKEITLSSDTECFAAEGTIDVADNGKVSASLTNEVKLLLGEDGIEVKGGEEYHAVMAVMGVDAPDGIYVEVAGVDKEGEPYTPLSYANPDFDTELVAGSYYTIDIVTDAVVKVGDNCYDNLVDAVAAAQNGDIVKMLADFQTTDQVTVGADKNIVLDLNGKTISYTTDGYGAFITNKGTLTVNDSSEGKNGKITAKHNKPDYMNGCYTIDNAGVSSGTSTLVIEAGTIENTSGAGLAWPVNNGSWGTSADLVINGGTIHSVNYVPVREYLHYAGKKTIVINGGKFISDNSRAIAVQCNDAVIKETEASVTINGGEFSCNGSGILYVDLHAANLDMTGFTMTVNGGKFKNANADAPVLVYDDEGNPQTTAKLLSKIIKGGIYSKEPAAELLADNYEVVDNDDDATCDEYPFAINRYYLAKIGENCYDTVAEAIAAATEGQTVQILRAGDYTVETLSTKAAVVEATVEGVVFNRTAGGWVASCNGTTVKNVTWNVGNANYQYFSNTNLENCTVNGLLCTHCTNKFKDCTFINEEGYNFWVYGNVYTEFDNCTFTCPGKNNGESGCGSALNCYNENAQTPTPVLVVKNCTFTAKEASNKYSAIFIKPETAFDIRITNSTCNDKFCTGAISGSKLWNLSKDREGTTVSIDDVLVYPFCSKDADGNYHITNATGLLQFRDLYVAGKVAYTAKVYIDNDIDFTGKTWTACEWHADTATKGFALFDGQNHTIKNFTVSGQGMFSRWACTSSIGATPYFKDIVFDDAKNVTSTLNVSLFCGQCYQDAKIENVTIKNSQFEGTYKVAPFVGTVYDEKPGSTATLTLKDCKVENTNVSGAYDFDICGMVAFVYESDNDHIAFEGSNVVKDVTLYIPSVNYSQCAKIYHNGETAYDEAANVTVNNVNTVIAN